MNTSMLDICNLPHYCYLITNTKNGKLYVGITYKKLVKRLSEHIKVAKSKGKKQAINKAIAKYGKENFTIKLIESFTNKKLAYEAEVKYIKQYNSRNPKYGYNETDGGDCGPIKLKYNIELLTNIINDYCDGFKLKDISKKYAVSYYNIFDITRLRISEYYDLPEKLIERLKLAKSLSNKRFAKTNLSDIIAIIQNFLNGKTMQQIANEFSLNINTVWNIIHRETWQEVDIGNELELKLKEKLSSNRYWKNNKAKSREMK